MKQAQRILSTLQNLVTYSGGTVEPDMLEGFADKMQHIMNSIDKRKIEDEVLEMSIFSHLIDNPMKVLDDEIPDDLFSVPSYKKALKVIRKKIMKEQLVSLDTVRQNVPQLPEDITKPADDFDYLKTLYHLKEIRDLRYLRKSCNKILRGIDEGSELKELESIVNSDFIDKQVDKEDSEVGVAQMVEYFKQLAEKKPTTGITSLDNLLKDALEVYMVIGARPNTGKTALALNILNNCLAIYPEKTALFFSIEMSAKQIYARLLCTEFKVDMNTLKKHYTSFADPDRKAGNFHDFFKKYNNSNAIIDDSSELTPSKVAQVINQLASRKKDISIVIIDYMQIMQSNTPDLDPVQRYSEISSSLKALVKKHKITLILLCQLNRNKESRGKSVPVLSDIKGSGAIEENADFIVMLDHDPDVPSAGQFVENIDFHVVKNKFGKKGIIKCKFKSNIMLFEDCV